MYFEASPAPSKRIRRRRKYFLSNSPLISDRVLNYFMISAIAVTAVFKRFKLNFEALNGSNRLEVFKQFG